jgi:hypothetical protein
MIAWDTGLGNLQFAVAWYFSVFQNVVTGSGAQWVTGTLPVGKGDHLDASGVHDSCNE